MSSTGTATREPATGAAPDAGRAWLFCSSSLGDDRVLQPRRELFRHLLATERDPFQAQDRLHRHAWPDRRHLSVLMSRTDACTVSRTEVRLEAGSVEMRYRPLVDGWPGPATARALSLATRVTAAA